MRHWGENNKVLSWFNAFRDENQTKGFALKAELTCWKVVRSAWWRSDAFMELVKTDVASLKEWNCQFQLRSHQPKSNGYTHMAQLLQIPMIANIPAGTTSSLTWKGSNENQTRMCQTVSTSNQVLDLVVNLINNFYTCICNLFKISI